MTRALLFTLLAVVAMAAAVLSFSALRDLGLACGFDPRLAWLVPIVVDAGAAAGSVSWLSQPSPVARVFGRRLAVVLLAASVIGNGIAHLLEAYRLEAPWWLVVAVSALAPCVLGAVVHLVVLAVQDDTERQEKDEEATRDEVGTAEVDDAPDRAAELLAEGIGRRRLARELGVSEYEARQLMQGHRNNGVTR
ncbi:MAG: DUF2637 domain-containing protein [Pseudonocardia sp.]|uniref:DUF2637 domain-containing protein n=1 Tax=Pseudonocardia sp. TaxID=60912 RepID=UPI001ACB123F|nr:DUF2637 domain-containing protein [Pseudonocardia sp.]MBN9101787.1 DUF2637 domain-containing protein [Pseudonocardia sp.]